MTAIGKTYRVVLATDQRGPIGRPKPAKTRKEAFRIAKEVINEAALTDSIGGWHIGETVMVCIEPADE